MLIFVCNSREFIKDVFSLVSVEIKAKQTKGDFTVSGLDHLLPFIDNGGRRSHIDRRRNSRIVARIPDRRKSKERRIDCDRRKNENMGGIMVLERRMKGA